MSRKDSLINASGGGEIQDAHQNATAYCSECTEKLLPWEPNNPARAWDFHRDLFELVECGNRCPLCGYISSLLKGPRLDDFLSRVTQYNEKSEEPLRPNAANEFVDRNGRLTSLLLLSRSPKGPPKVAVAHYLENSRLDTNGHRNSVNLQIYLKHHVAEIEDGRAFVVCTAERALERAIWSDAHTVDIKARSATIRSWLTECQTHHADCRKTLKPDTPLAARILAVQEHKPNQFSIQLVSTDSVDLHKDPYLVLSHVWGGVAIDCKTTTKNSTRYHDTGIDFQTLPATFQDAVRITAAIGFQYLWIDSLCIIQDSVLDWQRESAKMAAIFRAGTLTLSATSAENSKQGCAQTAAWLPATRFHSASIDGLAFAVREIPAYGHDPIAIVRDQLHHGTVNTRAWILQERLLSRRILHAPHAQFIWQCGHMLESEDGTMYQDKSVRLGNGWVDLHNHLPHNASDAFPGSWSGVYGLDARWWGWVEEYAGRNLTFSTDSYAAFAGIVQLHEYISGDTPIVGLWRRNLHLHLAWDVSREDRDNPTTLDALAMRRPSWTWMSYPHGSVRITKPQFEWGRLSKGSREGDMGIVYQAEILQTHVRWNGEPLTSEPNGSSIRIRGLLRRMAPPPPVGNALLPPLRFDPGVSALTQGRAEYDTIALIAYVQSAALINLPSYRTTVYLVVEPAGSEDKDEYVRIGRMNLVDDVLAGEGDVHRPKGHLREITLV